MACRSATTRSLSTRSIRQWPSCATAQRRAGHEQTIATLKSTQSLQHWYQLHRNINLADDQQAPASSSPTANRRSTAKASGSKPASPRTESHTPCRSVRTVNNGPTKRVRNSRDAPCYEQRKSLFLARILEPRISLIGTDRTCGVDELRQSSSSSVYRSALAINQAYPCPSVGKSLYPFFGCGSAALGNDRLGWPLLHATGVAE